MMTSIRLIPCLLTVLIAGCTGAAKQETLPADVQEAKAKAFNAGNAEALVALYTEDCVILQPNDKSMRGHSGVVAVYRTALRQGMKIAVNNEEAEVRGGLAYRMGTYEFTDKNGASMEKGKYIEIWRKQPQTGAWLLSREIWNTDGKPVVTAPTLLQ